MTREEVWHCYEEACYVTPGGAQTRSKMTSACIRGVYPPLLGHAASGCRVNGLDGREYIDWIAGLGAVGLGYTPGDPSSLPPTLPLPSVEERWTASALLNAVGGDLVRFVKTGSEACQGAVRIARIATGREHVLVCGYHGWHDWYQASNPDAAGIPHALRALITKVPYNDLGTLEQEFRSRPVAAFMLEPLQYTRPAQDYLARVIEMSHRYGAIAIFDESLTGFRYAIGGAKALYHVEPDLSIYAKALSNGYPLAAVVGTRSLMEPAARVISGTFGGEQRSLLAAQTTIYHYEYRPVIAHLWHIGDQIQGALRQLFTNTPMGVESDFPCRPRITTTNPLFYSVWLQEMVKQGILIHPFVMLPMFAHTASDVEQTIEAAERAINQTRAWWTMGGDENLRAHLEGDMYEESFKLTGHAG